MVLPASTHSGVSDGDSRSLVPGGSCNPPIRNTGLGKTAGPPFADGWNLVSSPTADQPWSRVIAVGVSRLTPFVSKLEEDACGKQMRRGNRDVSLPQVRMGSLSVDGQPRFAVVSGHEGERTSVDRSGGGVEIRLGLDRDSKLRHDIKVVYSRTVGSPLMAGPWLSCPPSQHVASVDLQACTGGRSPGSHDTIR